MDTTGHAFEAATRPPSLWLRALVAITMLVGFYVVVLGTALFLLALPVVHLATGGRFNLFFLLACLIPGGVLLGGAFNARPVRFRAPGPRLSRDQAPELFAIVDDLAARSGTRAPSEVYLEPTPNLGVLETGGFLGLGARRILCIGVPLLERLTVQELKAGLAHELGHFLGGDTKLCGVLSYTMAAFRAVLRTGERGAFAEGSHRLDIEVALELAQGLTRGIVGVYAKLFFWITRPASRRQEIAADAWSAALAGRRATVRALEKVSVEGPLYRLYLDSDVARAVQCGAMPSDLAGGFEAFCRSFRMTEEGHRIVEALRQEQTDPLDTHPALADRLAALRGAPDDGGPDDARPAIDLLVDLEPHRAWLARESLKLFEAPGSFRVIPWAEIASSAYEPAVRERARNVAAALYPRFPEATTLAAMFVRVVQTLERVGPAALAAQFKMRSGDASDTSAEVVAALLEGALLERGGVVEDSVGAPCFVIRLGDQRVEARRLASASLVDPRARDEVGRWAERLSRNPA